MLTAQPVLPGHWLPPEARLCSSGCRAGSVRFSTTCCLLVRWLTAPASERLSCLTKARPLLPRPPLLTLLRMPDRRSPWPRPSSARP